jgi:hypothetical protein
MASSAGFAGKAEHSDLEPTHGWQGGVVERPADPWNLRLQPQGFYPHSISRWLVVEVAAAFGLPLPT